ncbi:putative Caytaxin [Hypsibius exemplaris]|uniref:Caytaxin n=1 Tax=Hypsibius exemplaris TaxID=2072580 RepID=A0A1W0WFG7_HYPEX|nr:putative Caytaxin [Hypsibius exemplaris]
MAYDPNGQIGDTGALSLQLDDPTAEGAESRAIKQQLQPDGQFVSAATTTAGNQARDALQFSVESATDTNHTTILEANPQTVRSSFSLSVIQDIRPTPLDLFNPSANAPGAGTSKSSDKSDGELDSTADLLGDQSGCTLTPSESQESFEIIDDAERSYSGGDGESDDFSFTNLAMDIYGNKESADGAPGYARTVESADYFSRLGGQQNFWNNEQLDLEGQEPHEPFSWVPAARSGDLTDILRMLDAIQADNSGSHSEQYASAGETRANYSLPHGSGGHEESSDRNWAEIDQALQQLSEVHSDAGLSTDEDSSTTKSESVSQYSTFDLDAESYHRSQMYAHKLSDDADHLSAEYNGDGLSVPSVENNGDGLSVPNVENGDGLSVPSVENGDELSVPSVENGDELSVPIVENGDELSVPTVENGDELSVPSGESYGISSWAHAADLESQLFNSGKGARGFSSYENRSEEMDHGISDHGRDGPPSMESAEAFHRNQAWSQNDGGIVRRPSHKGSPLDLPQLSEYAGQELFFRRMSSSSTWTLANSPSTEEEKAVRFPYAGQDLFLHHAEMEPTSWTVDERDDFSEGEFDGQPLFFRHPGMGSAIWDNDQSPPQDQKRQLSREPSELNVAHAQRSSPAESVESAEQINVLNHDCDYLAMEHDRACLAMEHDRACLAMEHDRACLAKEHDRACLAMEHDRACLARETSDMDYSMSGGSGSSSPSLKDECGAFITSMPIHDYELDQPRIDSPDTVESAEFDMRDRMYDALLRGPSHSDMAKGLTLPPAQYEGYERVRAHTPRSDYYDESGLLEYGFPERLSASPADFRRDRFFEDRRDVNFPQPSRDKNQFEQDSFDSFNKMNLVLQERQLLQDSPKIGDQDNQELLQDAEKDKLSQVEEHDLVSSGMSETSSLSDNDADQACINIELALPGTAVQASSDAPSQSLFSPSAQPESYEEPIDHDPFEDSKQWIPSESTLATHSEKPPMTCEQDSHGTFGNREQIDLEEGYGLRRSENMVFDANSGLMSESNYYMVDEDPSVDEMSEDQSPDESARPESPGFYDDIDVSELRMSPRSTREGSMRSLQYEPGFSHGDQSQNSDPSERNKGTANAEQTAGILAVKNHGSNFGCEEAADRVSDFSSLRSWESAEYLLRSDMYSTEVHASSPEVHASSPEVHASSPEVHASSPEVHTSSQEVHASRQEDLSERGSNSEDLVLQLKELKAFEPNPYADRFSIGRTLESAEVLQRNEVYSNELRFDEMNNAGDDDDDDGVRQGMFGVEHADQYFTPLARMTVESAGAFGREQLYQNQAGYNWSEESKEEMQYPDTEESAELLHREAEYNRPADQEFRQPSVVFHHHADHPGDFRAETAEDSSVDDRSAASGDLKACSVESAEVLHRTFANERTEGREPSEQVVPDEFSQVKIYETRKPSAIFNFDSEEASQIGDGELEYQKWLDSQIGSPAEYTHPPVQQGDGRSQVNALVCHGAAEPNVLTKALSKILGAQFVQPMDEEPAMLHREDALQERKLVDRAGDHNHDGSLTNDSRDLAQEDLQPLRTTNGRSWDEMGDRSDDVLGSHGERILQRESSAGLYEMYNPPACVEPKQSDNEATASQSLESSGFHTAVHSTAPPGGDRPVKPPRLQPFEVSEHTASTAFEMKSLANQPIVFNVAHPIAQSAFEYPSGYISGWTFDEALVKPFHRVVDVVRDEQDGHAMPTAVLLYPCLFPFRANPDYDRIMHNLHRYILYTLQQLMNEDYRIILFNSGVPSHDEVSVALLTQMFKGMDMRMREHLRQLLIVHPNLKVKTELKTVGRAELSKDFYNKIVFVKSLQELSRVQAVMFADVPMAVRDFDRRRERKSLAKNTCC